MAEFMTKIQKKNTGASNDGLPMYMAADGAQDQKKKSGDGGGDDAPEAKGDGGKKMSKKGEDLKDEMDALVEDIDAVLEKNAEEFVKNYVQRGGE
ncbi:MAG: ubiquitin-like protein Pup [Myxococcota bacterium]|jgi:ubiquitin-like protein Pup